MLIENEHFSEDGILFDFSRASVKGNQYKVTIRNCKFSKCAPAMTNVSSKEGSVKWIAANILIKGPENSLFDSLEVCIENCVFQECGVNEKNSTSFEMCVAAIYVSRCKRLNITGSTFDGVVSLFKSYGVVVEHVDDANIVDNFFTDIYALKEANAYHFLDSNANVKQSILGSIENGVKKEDLLMRLSHHPSFKDSADIANKQSSNLDVSLLKNVVPFHIENKQRLLEELKWRDFRNLDRLVCHQAHLRSQTTARYSYWLENFCKQVFEVKVKVCVAFANLYQNGNVTLPFHRDQYHKWVFGLSFGETRTFVFQKDGNFFIFSKCANCLFLMFVFERDKRAIPLFT